MPLFGPPDISKLKAQKNIKGLSKALTYKRDATVRKNAAIALGELGDPAAIPALEAAIGDEKWIVSDQALIALGKIGTPEAVRLLASSLGSAKWDVQIKAQAILHGMGEIAVIPLIQTVNKGNATAKANAAQVLGKIKDPRAVDSLINGLQDYNPKVRLWVVHALKMIGDPRAVPPLTKMTNDFDKEVRSSVIEALGQLGDSGAAEMLVANLSHPDEKIREQTAATLERLNWEPTQDANGAWYWITKGNWRKCKSIGEPAVEPLLSALKSKNPTEVKTAVIVLGNMRESRALDPLIGILEAKDRIKGASDNLKILDEIKSAVCKAIGRIGGEPAIDALISAYHKFEGKNFQTNVFNALKELGKPALTEVKEMSNTARLDQLDNFKLLARLDPAASGIEPLLKNLKNKDIDEESYLKAVKTMASLYKSGNMSDAQKQTLLQEEDALHHQVASPLRHSDYEPSCSIHEDRFYKAKSKHIDFYDYI